MSLNDKRYQLGPVAVFVGFILLATVVEAAEKISLHALFANKAILLVDGKRRVVATGQKTPEGIRLISTDTAREQAVVEVGGRRQVLALGVVVSGGGLKSGNKASALLYAGPRGHFRINGRINDKPVQFMVDTGATQIAMNSRVAGQLGIDYRRQGRFGVAHTASGVVRVYNVTLDRVTVGGITLYNIEASVITGSHPRVVLLGMSFLSQVEMRRQGNMLELVKP